MDPGRICPRLPRPLGQRRLSLQDDRLLCARVRAQRRLERSHRRHRLADGRGADALCERQGRRATLRRGGVSMRLLVTGANGQVGWALDRSLAALGNVIALDRWQCDLSRPERLPKLIRSLKPDVIVNAAAYTAVDDAGREERLATPGNRAAVDGLAQEGRRNRAPLFPY